VTFTVSPRVRKIAAHNPDELPAAEYYRQIFWSSASQVEGLAASRSIVVMESVVENAHARALLETNWLKPTPRRVALSGNFSK
jgi:Family of unknown function (DUF5939)